MVTSTSTHFVYVSRLLQQRHPAIAGALRTALGERLQVIPGTRDIWCRDFMPIQIAANRFVQFRYHPDYLKGYPGKRTNDGGHLLHLPHCIRSGLVIDGGNIVRWNGTAILTNKIYRENPRIRPSRLRQELQRALLADRVIIIPREPGDTIGHADGVVRFVDGRTLLVNDYRRVNPRYGSRLHQLLTRHGFKLIRFPYRPTGAVFDGIDSAEGVYINFLQVDGMVMCPAFGLPQDDTAVRILARCFPRQRIIPVPCQRLAEGGGVLHCATWHRQAPGS